MRNIIIISILCLILLTAPCLAGPLVIVVDELGSPYHKKTVEGYEKAGGADIVHFDPSNYNMTTAGEYYRKSRPDLIFVLARDPLFKTRGIAHIPVVYALALYPDEIVGDRPNFTGVTMHIPEEVKFGILRKAMPSAENVGIIYSERSSSMMRECRLAAGKYGFRIISRKLEDIGSFSYLLKGIGGKIEVFWMVKDRDVYKYNMIEELFDYTDENAIPVVTFQNKFLEKGAFISISPDPGAMGAQAWMMSSRILNGTPIENTPPEPPKKAVVKINYEIARRLGLVISEELENLVKEGWSAN